MEQKAIELFNKADRQDQAGAANKETGTIFRTASLLMQVAILQVPDISETVCEC